MNILLILIVGALGIIFGYWLGRRSAGKRLWPRRDKWADLYRSQEDKERDLFGAAETRLSKKEGNLLELQGAFIELDYVTNEYVQEFLDVSDATAERYLDELEERGIIRQEGESGRGVRYKILQH